VGDLGFELFHVARDKPHRCAGQATRRRA
jgi:hypothetical protein